MKTSEKAIPPGEGRSRILVAALNVFATFGFEGASLRQIAQHAGVQHQLVVYHFKTKDALWRAAVASIFDTLAQERAPTEWAEFVKTVGPADALRQMLLAFAQFTARHPEMHRLLSLEGQTESERLDWLLDTYVRPLFEVSINAIRAAQKAGLARLGDPGRLHYAAIGVITSSLVLAKEYRCITGLDPFAPAEVESVVELACDLLGLPKIRRRISRRTKR